MAAAKVVSPSEYRPLRLSLLEKEKELTRAKDALTKKLRELPAVEVTTPYKFTALDGQGAPTQVTLADLFGGRPQLVVYHFMFDPAWEEGCASCSLYADHVPPLEHLNSHATSYVVVSRAPLEKIAAYQKRMGWTFPWVSSHGTSFNYDFHVTMDDAVTPVEYNFRARADMRPEVARWAARGEQPGHSVFVVGGHDAVGIGDKGKIYHTYSSYARGGESVINTLALLDFTPLGRQDGVSGVDGLGYKRRDEYTQEDLKGNLKG